MKNKILLAFLVCSIHYISAQNSIPQRKELFGKWVVEKDDIDTSVVYLSNPELFEDGYNGDINFFVKYTNTLRLRYVLPIVVKKEGPRVRRCGNDSRPAPPTWYETVITKSKIEAVCAYNPEDGMLKISDANFLGGTLFYVKKINFKEMILTKIK